MKIFFNRKPVGGPWGGGSKVLSSIVQEAIKRNHEVYFEEDFRKELRFDIYFCMDPRPGQLITYKDIFTKRSADANARLVQRIGDLGTHGKPDLFKLVKETSLMSDFLIFPSEWSRQYLDSQNKKSSVIHNAPLPEFFVNKKKLSTEGKLKIVSHHWSDNQMKGFDLYKKLDEFCDSNKSLYEFLFIGRKPSDINLRNYLEPQDIQGLKNFLPENHIYITASKKEAGANHVLEAMAVGLPVLYHADGGSINEYCAVNGICYENFENLKDILLNKRHLIIDLYNSVSYSRNSLDMSNEYLNLLESIHEDKHKH